MSLLLLLSPVTSVITESVWRLKSRILTPHYMALQNGDLIAFQNGDAMYTHNGQFDWTHKEKQPS